MPGAHIDGEPGIDVRALALQRLDVPIDGPERDTQFLGQPACRDGPTVASQELDHIKKALGARHVARYHTLLPDSVSIGVQPVKWRHPWTIPRSGSNCDPELCLCFVVPGGRART